MTFRPWGDMPFNVYIKHGFFLGVNLFKASSVMQTAKSSYFTLNPKAHFSYPDQWCIWFHQTMNPQKKSHGEWK